MFQLLHSCRRLGYLLALCSFLLPWNAHAQDDPCTENFPELIDPDDPVGLDYRDILPLLGIEIGCAQDPAGQENLRAALEAAWEMGSTSYQGIALPTQVDPDTPIDEYQVFIEPRTSPPTACSGLLIEFRYQATNCAGNRSRSQFVQIFDGTVPAIDGDLFDFTATAPFDPNDVAAIGPGATPVAPGGTLSLYGQSIELPTAAELGDCATVIRGFTVEDRPSNTGGSDCGEQILFQLLLHTDCSTEPFAARQLSSLNVSAEAFETVVAEPGSCDAVYVNSALIPPSYSDGNGGFNVAAVQAALDQIAASQTPSNPLPFTPPSSVSTALGQRDVYTVSSTYSGLEIQLGVRPEFRSTCPVTSVCTKTVSVGTVVGETCAATAAPTITGPANDELIVSRSFLSDEGIGFPPCSGRTIADNVLNIIQNAANGLPTILGEDPAIPTVSGEAAESTMVGFASGGLLIDDGCDYILTLEFLAENCAGSASLEFDVRIRGGLRPDLTFEVQNRVISPTGDPLDLSDTEVLDGPIPAGEDFTFLGQTFALPQTSESACGEVARQFVVTASPVSSAFESCNAAFSLRLSAVSDCSPIRTTVDGFSTVQIGLANMPNPELTPIVLVGSLTPDDFSDGFKSENGELNVAAIESALNDGNPNGCDLPFTVPLAEESILQPILFYNVSATTTGLQIAYTFFSSLGTRSCASSSDPFATYNITVIAPDPCDATCGQITAVAPAQVTYLASTTGVCPADALGYIDLIDDANPGLDEGISFSGITFEAPKLEDISGCVGGDLPNPIVSFDESLSAAQSSVSANGCSATINLVFDVFSGCDRLNSTTVTHTYVFEDDVAPNLSFTGNTEFRLSTLIQTGTFDEGTCLADLDALLGPVPAEGNPFVPVGAQVPTNPSIEAQRLIVAGIPNCDDFARITGGFITELESKTDCQRIFSVRVDFEDECDNTGSETLTFTIFDDTTPETPDDLTVDLMTSMGASCFVGDFGRARAGERASTRSEGGSDEDDGVFEPGGVITVHGVDVTLPDLDAGCNDPMYRLVRVQEWDPNVCGVASRLTFQVINNCFFDFYQPRIATVALDDFSLENTFTLTVNVKDNTGPVFIDVLEQNASVACNSPEAGQLFEQFFTLPLAFDECTNQAAQADNDHGGGAQSLSLEGIDADAFVEVTRDPTIEYLEGSPRTGCFVAQVTFRATDRCDNETVYKRTLTVTDDTPPEFSALLPAGGLVFETSQTELAEAGLNPCLEEADLTGLAADLEELLNAINRNSCNPVVDGDWPIEVFMTKSEGGDDMMMDLVYEAQRNPLLGMMVPRVSLAQDACGGVDYSVEAVNENDGCTAALGLVITATDCCNNSASYPIGLIIEDDLAPIVVEGSFETSITAECGDDLSPEALGMPSFVELCAGTGGSSLLSATNEGITVTHKDLVGKEGPCGRVIIRTFTATDACGNTLVATSVPQIITVEDTKAPIVDPTVAAEGLSYTYTLSELQAQLSPKLCPADFIQGASSLASDLEDALNATVPDACAEFEGGDGDGSDDERFTALLIDHGGDDDSMSPSFLDLTEVAPGSAIAAIVPRAALGEDACTDVRYSVQPVASGDLDLCNLVFGFIVTVSDCCGNETQYTIRIDIIDDVPPVLDPASYEAVVDINCDDDTSPEGVGMPTFEDPCSSIPIVTLLREGVDGDDSEGMKVTFADVVDRTLACPVLYTITRTFTAEDLCGNTAQATQLIRVNDTDRPILKFCPEDIGPLFSEPDGKLAVWFPAPSFADDCGIEIEASHRPGDRFEVGTTVVTYTATDACGRRSTCTFRIVIRNPLTIECGELDVAVDPGEANFVDINWPFASSLCDDCPQGDRLPGLVYIGYYRGHRYYASAPGQELSFNKAYKLARDLGGNLAEVGSDGENRFLTNELPYEEAFIGLVNQEDEWHWINNGGGAAQGVSATDAVLYRNWAAGQPSSASSATAGLLSQSGKHTTGSGQSERPFIIEFPCINMSLTFDTEGPGPHGVGRHCYIYTARDRCGNTAKCHFNFYVDDERDVRYCDPTAGENLFSEARRGEGQVVLRGLRFGDSYARSLSANDGLFDRSESLTEVSANADGEVGFTLVASWLEFRGAPFQRSSAFSGYYRVWVDADSDGDFYDDGELVYSGTDASASIAWPAGVTAGERLRVRFGVGRYDFPEACGSDPFADYRDVVVVVGSTTDDTEEETETAEGLTLAGEVIAGRPVLQVTMKAESERVAAYIMLRGEESDRMGKYDYWSAEYRDGAAHSYSYTEEDPATVAYYQVASIDGDGRYVERSNVAEVRLPLRKGTGPVLSAFPSPARDYVFVEHRNPREIIYGRSGAEEDELQRPSSDGQLELFDAVGRSVARQVWPAGQERVRMQLPRLATGTYLLRETREGSAPQTVRVVIDQGGAGIVPRA